MVSIIVVGILLFPFSIIKSCIPLPNIVWRKTWGGVDQEIMHEMVVDSTGHYFIVGETWGSSSSSKDLFLVKMNESSCKNAIWGGNAQEEFSGMVVDSNYNLFIAGSHTDGVVGIKDVFLLKYINNLTLDWNITWGSSGFESCNGIAVDSLNNIYITGNTKSLHSDVFLLKYNNSGALIWSRIWNTKVFNISEEVLSIVIDSSDQIFLGVNTNITGSEWFLLKYNSSGSLLFNASFNKYNPSEQLALDFSDNLYAVGSCNNTYLTKLDNYGNIKWNFTCIQEVFEGTEILEIDDSDNIFITGNELINASAIIYGYNMTDYDTYLMKFNTSGNLIWNYTISRSNNLYPEVLTFDPLGNIYFGGSLEMIAPGSLTYRVLTFDHSGFPKGSSGGGCIKGDGICKGIYAESLGNFTFAINSPCYGEGDYDIILMKYIERENICSMPNTSLNLFIQGLLSTVFIIIGIYFFVIRPKRIMKQK